MSWMRHASTVVQPTAPSADAAEEPSGGPADGDGGGGSGGPGLVAPSFVVAILGLALVLMIWAPWREERLSLSDFGGRVEAVGPAAPAASPSASAMRSALSTGGAGPAVTAAPAAGVGSGVRPVGLPVKRNDWIIVRDYVANGGPGPTGAIDIGVVGNRDAVGTPVYATSDGTAKVVRNTRLLGNLVVIRSGRWITTYGYLDQATVVDGQAVRRGDQIGTLGRSGQAPNPMVNYQVWEQAGAEELNRNPMEFIAPR